MNNYFGIKQVAVIGVGQLGSRHLQALALSEFDICIYVIDPNEESIKLAKKRFISIPKNEKVRFVNFAQSIHELPKQLDLAIIATNSDVRFQIISELVKKRTVKNIVLEKVLFQSVHEYKLADAIFQEKDIRVWVNCVRRSLPFYKEIKKYFPPTETIQFSAIGNQWGIACNSIHLIDLLGMFTESCDYSLDTAELDKKIHQSKRKEFIEFSGTLKGSFSDHQTFTFTSKMDSQVSLQFIFDNDRYQLEVNEISKSALLKNKLKSTTKMLEFTPYYQSTLSHIIAKEIFESDNCSLSSYKDAMNLHLPLIKGLLEFQQKLEGVKIEKLNIT